ncbi:MAG: hypothetical protein QXS37_05955, partial [Candidatus Aenigmatarchaeota archaeon]
FVSATRLESFLGNRKSLNIDSIFKLLEVPCCCFPYSIDFDLISVWELHCIHDKCRFLSPCFPFCCRGVLGISHFASNVYDFVDKYLKGCVGELIYSDIGIYNKPAFYFLQEMFSVIKEKAQKNNNKGVIDFVNDFFRYPYGDNHGRFSGDTEFDDFEGGGIGFIFTLIDLGKGQE